MKAVLAFVKKETVLCAAFVLAVVSAFFVVPSKAYLDYIDWRVLGLLLSLMLIMAGLQKANFFRRIGTLLLHKTKNAWQLGLVLVLLCFGLSMFITNDVALITFVPFAIATLSRCSKEKLIMPIVILQTLAANLGSMLTPLGNPQNLYLYALSDMSLGSFIVLMLPYSAVSFVVIAAATWLICRADGGISHDDGGDGSTDKKRTIIYIILFVICLFAVLRVLAWYIALAVVVAAVLVMDRSVMGKADYSLLMTFICFFVFTGNMGRLPAVHDTLASLVMGHEIACGVVLSQVISNVPAALMLSDFTDNLAKLVVGVNLGGLGTLIASMASLISYKLYANAYPAKKGRYLLLFTASNVAMLAVLLIFAAII